MAQLFDVALRNNLRLKVSVEAGATKGAQVGVNLTDPQGNLVKWSDILNVATTPGGGSSSITTTDDLDEGAFNLYFTDRRAQDAVGAILDNTSNITLTYDNSDPGNNIKADLTDVTPGSSGRLYGLSFDSKGRLANQHALTVTGTANQVLVTGGDGSGASIALATPQDIATTSSPTFAQVTVAADPTSALQVATKQYVDALAQGLDPKQSCRLGTTTNDTLSGLAARDGVTPVSGNRVLVKSQTTPAQNGIYVAASGAWTRATDMDAWTEVPGAFTFIEEGTTLADSGWVCTSNQGGTIGTTPITWVQFAGAGTVTAGTGITVTGNQVSITNTTVTAGTAGDSTHFPIITFNAQGQATGYTTQAITSSGLTHPQVMTRVSLGF
jgi:hypothetical protein